MLQMAGMTNFNMPRGHPYHPQDDRYRYSKKRYEKSFVIIVLSVKLIKVISTYNSIIYLRWRQTFF